MKTQTTKTTSATTKKSISPVTVTLTGELAEKVRAAAETAGMSPEKFGEILASVGESVTAPNKAAVKVPVTKRMGRLLDRHGVTPDKFVNTIWKAVSQTTDLDEVLAGLYRKTGKKNEIHGLFIVGTN